MLEVKGIASGVVIDHITSGNGIKIFNALFKETEYPIVLLMNVSSELLGKKDIIKIEGTDNVDLAMLGIMDNGITVNYIKDEQLVRKIKVEIPTTIKGGIKCQNPRCISHTDDYAIPEFRLVSSNGKLKYECSYCEEVTTFKLENM